MENTRAILIRRSRLSDTSLICTWITLDAGKLRTAARGALRPGTPFFGKLDLFFEADIAFTYSRKGDLHQLREVVLVAPFDGAGTQYPNLATASYLGELIDAVTESLAPAPEIFSLMERAVRHLREKAASPRVVEFFEQELARLSGIHDPSGREEPLHSLRSIAGRIPRSRSRLFRTLVDFSGSCAQRAEL